MTQQYYSWQELTEDYRQNYHDGSLEIKAEDLYRFLRDRCQDSISWVQTLQVLASLQTVDNIRYLYQKVDILQLTLQVVRFV
jgi:hypothetical protein